MKVYTLALLRVRVYYPPGIFALPERELKSIIYVYIYMYTRTTISITLSTDIE